MAIPWSALLLGVIEGITEFLPISSTGHLLVAEQWLGARSDLFNIAIQSGAILAVTFVYRDRLGGLVRGIRQPENRVYAGQLALAFIVTAAFGFGAMHLGFKLPTGVQPVAWALVLGGIWMLLAEAIATRLPRSDRITWPVALAVGIAQVAAGIFPGLSRSATTIFAAMLIGSRDRSVATEFSFLAGIPTMYAATAYELCHALCRAGGTRLDWYSLSAAFVASAISALLAVKWLLGYIKNHRFTMFVWYRIVLGVILGMAIVLGWAQ